MSQPFSQLRRRTLPQRLVCLLIPRLLADVVVPEQVAVADVVVITVAADVEATVAPPDAEAMVALRLVADRMPLALPRSRLMEPRPPPQPEVLAADVEAMAAGGTTAMVGITEAEPPLVEPQPQRQPTTRETARMMQRDLLRVRQAAAAVLLPQ